MNIDEPSKNTFSVGLDQEDTDKLNHYSEVMDKLLCLGSHILNAMRQDTVTHPNKREIILVMFRRVMELIDSASVQISYGCVFPCISNLRIILETLLQLEYLLKDPNLIMLKYKHFVIMELDGDLETYENVLKNPSGNIDRAAIIRVIQDTKVKIQGPYFDDVRDLYVSKVFKTNGERKAQTVKWYSFTSNANSVRYLAENLQKLGRYYMVYAVASNLTHSSRLLSDTLYEQEGTVYIRRIRDTEGLDDVANQLLPFQ